MKDMISGMFNTLRQVAGSPVLYRQGTAEVELSAIPRATKYDLIDSDGIQTTFTVMDFTVLNEDLGLVPQPGDTITSGAMTYTVLAIGSEPCWTWADSYSTMLRIHTKQGQVQ